MSTDFEKAEIEFKKSLLWIQKCIDNTQSVSLRSFFISIKGQVVILNETLIKIRDDTYEKIATRGKELETWKQNLEEITNKDVKLAEEIVSYNGLKDELWDSVVRSIEKRIESQIDINQKISELKLKDFTMFKEFLEDRLNNLSKSFEEVIDINSSKDNINRIFKSLIAISKSLIPADVSALQELYGIWSSKSPLSKLNKEVLRLENYSERIELFQKILLVFSSK